MQSQVSTATSLAAIGHNPLLAAFTAAHQQNAAGLAGTGSGGSGTPAGGGTGTTAGSPGQGAALLSHIHPAFLHPFYNPFAAGVGFRPAVLAAAAISAGAGNNVNSGGNASDGDRPGSAGKSFTIDAILGRGEAAVARGSGPVSAGVRRREAAGGGAALLGNPAAQSLPSRRPPHHHHHHHQQQHHGRYSGTPASAPPHPYLTTLANPLGFRSAFSSRGEYHNAFSVRLPQVFFRQRRKKPNGINKFKVTFCLRCWVENSRFKRLVKSSRKR